MPTAGARHFVISPSKPQPDSSTQEVLAGLVERVAYHNAENGFSVLRIKARGHRDLVTVVGYAATRTRGRHGHRGYGWRNGLHLSWWALSGRASHRRATPAPD